MISPLCVFVESKGLLENLLNILVICVNSSKLQYDRKRLFETRNFRPSVFFSHYSVSFSYFFSVKELFERLSNTRKFDL